MPRHSQYPLALVLALIAPLAAEEEAFRDTVEFRVVRDAWEFCDGAVGEGGDCPAEVHALRLLLEREDALPALRALFAEARPAGQLYALAGLGLLDPVDFQRKAAACASREEEVECMSGCEQFARPLRELVLPGDYFTLANDALVREICGRHLDELPPASASAIEQAVANLTSDDRAARLAAWRLLSRAGRAATPALRQALREGSRELREQAAGILSLDGPLHTEALPDLIACVRNPAPEADICGDALEAIRAQSYWAAARDAPEQLWAVLEDDATHSLECTFQLITTVRALCSGLETARDGEGLPPFVERFEPEPTQAGAGVLDLRPERPPAPAYRLRAFPPATVRLLTKAISEDEDHGDRAAYLLAEVGELTPLLDSLKRPGWSFAADALADLPSLPSRAEEVRRAVEEWARDGSPQQREAAAEVLETLDALEREAAGGDR